MSKTAKFVPAYNKGTSVLYKVPFTTRKQTFWFLFAYKNADFATHDLLCVKNLAGVELKTGYMPSCSAGPGT